MNFNIKINIGGKQIDANVRFGSSDGKFDNRMYAEITTSIAYGDAVELFVNDATWSTNYDDMIETDRSEYSVAGPITDNRDGTITILMGKPTLKEINDIPLAGNPPRTYEEAVVLRGIIETAMQSVDDNTALKAINLYPAWEDLVAKGIVAVVGFKFRHEGKLYKTLTDGDIFVSNWVPGNGTESLYLRIDETSTGTLEDPIPYDGNMVLENGKYYIQDGVVYLCNRDTVAAVYHPLKDLVGLYVEVAE